MVGVEFRLLDYSIHHSSTPLPRHVTAMPHQAISWRISSRHEPFSYQPILRNLLSDCRCRAAEPIKFKIRSPTPDVTGVGLSNFAPGTMAVHRRNGRTGLRYRELL